LVEDFDGGGILGKVKEKVEALVEFWGLWWLKWRRRRKKMKMESWRSCSGCCGGDEGEVGGGLVLVKRKMKGNEEGKVYIGFRFVKVM